MDGNVDMPRMEKTLAVDPLAVTFHRAFDMCANPLYTLNNLAELGIASTHIRAKIRLTARFIKIMELIAHRDAPIIMAGAGVRAENLHHFLHAGVLEFDSSAGGGKPHRCVILIKDCPCHQMNTRTSIRVIS
ncbi:copper homeostasis protein CutC [Shigella flexneri]